MMHRTRAIGGMLSCLPLLGLVASGGSAPQKGLDEPVRSAPAQNINHTYVGTKKCRMCHVNQYRSWKESANANAFEALKPGVGSDVKQRSGLDVSRDYTRDQRCLPCHTVGFGRPGGYAVPAADDTRATKQAALREGVGCEACHGPGSGFVKIMQDINRTDRTYEPAELYAVGRIMVDRHVCVQCHNTSAICMIPVGSNSIEPLPTAWLEVDVPDRHGYHAAFPLPHRKNSPDGKVKQP